MAVLVPVIERYIQGLGQLIQVLKTTPFECQRPELFPPRLNQVQPASVSETGQRTKMVNSAGETTWSHDLRGQVMEEDKTIDGVTYQTQWAYNEAGNVTQMTYPDGEEVTLGYLPQLAPDTLTGSASYVTNTEYDAEGRVTTRDLGNGLRSAYEYYAWEEGENDPGYQQGGRLHALVTAIGETTYQDLSYHYDPGGETS